MLWLPGVIGRRQFLKVLIPWDFSLLDGSTADLQDCRETRMAKGCAHWQLEVHRNVWRGGFRRRGQSREHLLHLQACM